MVATELQTQHFIQLVNGFTNELSKENRDEVFKRENTSYIKELLQYMEQRGITEIKTITQSHIDAYLKYLEYERINLRRGGLLSPDTINKHIGAIRRFWKYLYAENIKANSFDVKQKTIQHVKETTVLSHQEIEWYYSVTGSTAVGCRDKAMLAIYYGCGLRKKEGLKILLPDIDFSRGKIFIRKSKNGRERYVIMSPSVQKQVEEYVYSYRDFYLSEESQYQELFIGERGRPVSIGTLDKRMEELEQRVMAQYPFEKHATLHTLRHTLGTHLYMAGFGIEEIALMLGHESLEATQLYIHLAQTLKH